MPTTNTSFSALIAAIDSKAQSLASSTTDPKDLVFLGKAIEAMNTADTVSAIIDEGDTQVAAVNTAGTTQVNNVNTAGTNQVAAVQAAGASYATQANVDALIAEITVTVANSKFVIDGTAQKAIRLTPSVTYRFDTSDASNAGHPLKFSTTADGTHASPAGTEFTTGVTTVGTAGSANSYVQIIVEQDSPTLYYYCANHSGMGGTAYSAYDVLSTAPSDGQVLTYDATAAAYVNRDSSGGAAADLSVIDTLITPVDTYMSSVRSDAYQILPADGGSSTQLNATQFGLSGWYASDGANRLYFATVPFQLSSTGTLTTGTGAYEQNSTGVSSSTTMSGEVSAGIMGLATRSYWSNSYAVMIFAGQVFTDNTAICARYTDQDYSDTYGAHPQNGRLYGTTNTSGNDLNLSYTGYGGSANYARTVWYPITPGTISNKSMTIANNQYNQPSGTNTSTCNTVPIGYEWDTTLTRRGVEIHRNSGIYKVRLNTQTDTMSNNIYDMPMGQQTRGYIQALAFSNNYHLVFDAASGGGIVLDANGTQVATVIDALLQTNDSVHAKSTVRRVGDNLFVDVNAQGYTVFYTMSFDPTTSEITSNIVGTCRTAAPTYLNDAAYNLFLAGANNEYLVYVNRNAVISYDLASVIDLSGY